MAEDESVATLSDETLLFSLKACVANEKRALVEVLVRIAEVDRRELYSKRTSCSSLFAFVVRELGYSEDAAYRRIVVAQAAAKFPILYRRLAKGRISLSAAAKLAKRLKPENCKELLDRCEGASLRDVDRLLAELEPAPEMPRDRVRFLGTATMAPAEVCRLPLAEPADAGRSARETELLYPDVAAPRPRAPAPAATESSRVEIRFPADERFYRRLERARALLRHKYPAGRFVEVMTDAIDALLEKIDPDRRWARREKRRERKGLCGARAAARDGAERAIPLRLRDEVWRRDGSRANRFLLDVLTCAFPLVNIAELVIRAVFFRPLWCLTATV